MPVSSPVKHTMQCLATVGTLAVAVPWTSATVEKKVSFDLGKNIVHLVPGKEEMRGGAWRPGPPSFRDLCLKLIARKRAEHLGNSIARYILEKILAESELVEVQSDIVPREEFMDSLKPPPHCCSEEALKSMFEMGPLGMVAYIGPCAFLRP